MISVTAGPFLRAGKTNGVEVADRGIPTGMATRAGNVLGVRIGQSSAVVAGANADAQDGSGEGFELAAWWCGGQVARAVTGVDADDEHREYGGYRAGQERGDDEQDDGGGH